MTNKGNVAIVHLDGIQHVIQNFFWYLSSKLDMKDVTTPLSQHKAKQ